MFCHFLKVDRIFQRGFQIMTFLFICCSSFNPVSFPSSLTERYQHGRENIAVLAAHYGCDRSEILSEWKEVLEDTLVVSKMTKTREFLSYLSAHHSIYPNLCQITCGLLVVPMHSADCERGFSTLGRVRIKLPSCLTNSSLNSLLTISLEGPSL